MSTTGKYTYPWTQNNRFSLLVDGHIYFPPILAAIAEARSSIFLEMYLVESGRVLDSFIDALSAARQRQVGVYMLVDDFGVRGTNSRDRQRLRQAGIHLVRYNPVKLARLRRSLFRDHRKIIVIDGHTAFVGGTGLTDQFWYPSGSVGPWHDVMLQIEGDCVGHWYDLFCSTWQRWSTIPLPSQPPASHPAGAQPGRVVVNSKATHLEIKRSFLSHAKSARHRLWIATAYFVPSWKLRRFLCRAAARGVDVRLLLPGPATDHPAIRHAGRRFYEHLMQRGVRIFEYQPRFIHAKVLLSDDWVSVGSSNIDRWGQRWNLDANQEVQDKDLATQAETFFTRDFAVSREIHPQTWQYRPWYRRLLEWFWGKVDIWLEKR